MEEKRRIILTEKEIELLRVIRDLRDSLKKMSRRLDRAEYRIYIFTEPELKAKLKEKYGSD